MKPRFEVHASSIAGRGGFATEDILSGTTICFMEGEVISLEESGKREMQGSENEGDSLQIDDETYIDMEDIYRCLNHSCNPNAGIRGKNELIAIKLIKKGEEIMYDYSTTMWEEADKLKRVYNEEGFYEIHCKCGAKQCRGKVTEFYKLPKKIQERYIMLKAVPDYILKKMSTTT